MVGVVFAISIVVFIFVEVGSLFLTLLLNGTELIICCEGLIGSGYYMVNYNGTKMDAKRHMRSVYPSDQDHRA